MTLKEFEKLRKDRSKYLQWYEKKVEENHCLVDLDGITHRCVKALDDHYALLDGTLLLVDDVFVTTTKDKVEDETLYFRKMTNALKQLSEGSRSLAYRYVGLLHKKDEMENEIREVVNEPTDIRCSFCRKPKEGTEKLIAAPGNVYICDECVDLCYEIVSADR